MPHVNKMIFLIEAPRSRAPGDREAACHALAVPVQVNHGIQCLGDGFI